MAKKKNDHPMQFAINIRRDVPAGRKELKDSLVALIEWLDQPELEGIIFNLIGKPDEASTSMVDTIVIPLSKK